MSIRYCIKFLLPKFLTVMTACLPLYAGVAMVIFCAGWFNPDPLDPLSQALKAFFSGAALSAPISVCAIITLIEWNELANKMRAYEYELNRANTIASKQLNPQQSNWRS